MTDETEDEVDRLNQEQVMGMGLTDQSSAADYVALQQIGDVAAGKALSECGVDPDDRPTLHHAVASIMVPCYGCAAYHAAMKRIAELERPPEVTAGQRRSFADMSDAEGT
jgi:hypothetical protein